MDPIIRLPVLFMFLIQAWGAEGDLLDRIVAAQADYTTAVGVFDRSISQAEFPDMDPQRFLVRLWVEAPAKYHLRFEQAGDEPGVYTAFVGNGQTQWKVEIWDPEEPADIVAKDAEEGGAMERIKDLVPLRREPIETDFALEALAREGGGAQLILRPKEADLRKHIEHIEVDFDAALEVEGVRIHFTEGNLETWQRRELSHPETIEAERFIVE